MENKNKVIETDDGIVIIDNDSIENLLLNNVQAIDHKGKGNANHIYGIIAKDSGTVFPLIKFQKGGRQYEDSVPGVCNEDLLKIVIHRLKCFQGGDFACSENQLALDKIKEGFDILNKRTLARHEQNVLGEDKPHKS